MSLDDMKNKLTVFNSYLTSSDKDSITNYYEEMESGLTDMQVRQACYSPILYTEGFRKESKYIGVSTHCNRGDATPSKERKAYFNYLMTSHPLSHLFYKTSQEFADKQGMFVKTAEHPSNQVGYVLKAIRIAWEHVSYLSTWYTFVKAGMNERAAAMLAGVLNVSKGGVVSSRSYPSHNIFTSKTSEEFKSYLKGDVKKNKAYNKSLMYIDSDLVFKIGSPAIAKLVASASEEKRVKTGKNPFTGKAVYATSEASLSGLVKAVDKYMEKLK